MIKKIMEKAKVSREEVSKQEVSKKESGFWQSKAFNMVRIIYNNNIRSFFPKNFKEGTIKEQKAVLLDAIKLYDGRSKIIRLFENKNIKPSNYPHNAKFELDEHNIKEKFEPKEYHGAEAKIRSC